MDAFHWIVVPISTVLGLTIARVRRHASPRSRRGGGGCKSFDWIPALLFAGVVLGEDCTLVGAVELSVLPSWSLLHPADRDGDVLFIAGSIVVPSEMDPDMRLARAGWAMGLCWPSPVFTVSPSGQLLAMARGGSSPVQAPACPGHALPRCAPSHRRQWHAVGHPLSGSA